MDNTIYKKENQSFDQNPMNINPNYNINNEKYFPQKNENNNKQDIKIDQNPMNINPNYNINNEKYFPQKNENNNLNKQDIKIDQIHINQKFNIEITNRLTLTQKKENIISEEQVNQPDIHHINGLIMNQIQMQINNLQNGQEFLKNQINQLNLQQEKFMIYLEKILNQMIPKKNEEINIPQKQEENVNQNLIHNVRFKSFERYNNREILIDAPFSENEKISSLIQRYQKKVNDYGNKKFIFRSKPLNHNLSCKEAGLLNYPNDVILVIDFGI